VCSFGQANLADKPGHHVIIVCSTTGNGEPPDNAGKFWRFVKRRTQPKDMLANLAFTVLGLGDTNYDRFWYVAPAEGWRLESTPLTGSCVLSVYDCWKCSYMGKSIDKRFAELGARRYYDLCKRDALESDCCGYASVLTSPCMNASTRRGGRGARS
jgi:sulfite reductase alpha subunit-like flavoprotein